MTKSTKKLSRSEIRHSRGRTELHQLLKRRRKQETLAARPADGEPPSDPAASPDVLNRLAAKIRESGGRTEGEGHAARLLARGVPQVAQKLGEEAIECVVALVGGQRADIVAESADILYHLLVAWAAADVRPEEVWTELHRREELSALIEGKTNFAKETLRLTIGTSKVPF